MYHVCQFSDKTNNFHFFGPNLPKSGFWGRNFKNLLMCANFQSKWTTYYLFALTLGKLPNYVRNELDGGGWSWMEVEMSWVELDGGG